MQTVSWEDWLEHRDDLRARALAGAKALRAHGHTDPGAIGTGWRFTGTDALQRVVLDALRRWSPAPGAPELTAVLGPSGDLPPPPDGQRRGTPVEHLARLIGRVEASSSSDPLAWALWQLGFWGGWIEDRERAAWTRERWPTDPEADAETAMMWVRWSTGDYWTLRQDWEERFLPVARRAFAGALTAHHLPSGAREMILQRLEGAFFFFLANPRVEPQGWSLVAGRAVETARPGPVASLVTVAGPRTRDVLARCAAHRGVRARTAEAIWTDHLYADRRAEVLAAELETDPAFSEAFLDVHVALRLLERWSQGQSTRPHAVTDVILQGRTRARSRLRSAVAQHDRAQLVERLLTLDALHARTARAVAKLAWSWAHDELRYDYPFDEDRPLAPPCAEVARDVPELEPERAPAVRTWVLLAVMKGQLHRLERWVHSGGTGDRDPVWGRLLAQELPEELADPGDGRRRSRTYHRIRLHLGDELPDHLEALVPVIEALADLGPLLESSAGRRRLKHSFLTALGPVWEPCVPRPRSGFPTFVRNLAQVRASLAERSA